MIASSESPPKSDQSSVGRSKHFFTKMKPDAASNQLHNHTSRKESGVPFTFVADDSLKANSIETPRHEKASAVPAKKQEKEATGDAESSKTIPLSGSQSRGKNNEHFISVADTSSAKTEEAPKPNISGDGPPVALPANHALLNLARPAGPRNVHQPDTKCVVKVSEMLICEFNFLSSCRTYNGNACILYFCYCLGLSGCCWH